MLLRLTTWRVFAGGQYDVHVCGPRVRYHCLIVYDMRLGELPGCRGNRPMLLGRCRCHPLVKRGVVMVYGCPSLRRLKSPDRSRVSAESNN
jgi:hypothetical protein